MRKMMTGKQMTGRPASHNRAWNRRLLYSVLAMAVGASALAGCSPNTKQEPAANNSPNPGTATPAPPAPAKPTEIKMMNILYNAEGPKDSNEIEKELEKMTNTQLNITWVPEAAYNDKMNAMLASGELPHVFLSLATKSSNIINAARAGAFWEIGPYLQKFPNLNKINREVMDSTAIDGKNFMLIRTRDVARHIIAYRKDWAANLGLPEPKTVDDLYKMAKAFTENDPDKNGKNDTIGFTESNSLESLTRSVSMYFGAPSGYGVVNNELVPAFATPEYLEALKFYRKMFAEKLMNTDFPLVNKNQANDLLIKGKAGIMIGADSGPITFQADIAKVDPKAEVGLLQAVSGPKGLRVSATGGFLGGFLFSKSTIKTEAELMKVLEFFDKLSTPEGMTLIYHGIKDVDYKLVDKYAEELPGRAEQRKIDVAYSYLGVLHANVALPKKRSPFEEAVYGLVAQNEKIAVFDPSKPLISETGSEKGAELEKIMKDAQVKFIMGQLDEAGYAQAIEQWRKRGGEQMLKEYNEEYKKTAKK